VRSINVLWLGPPALPALLGKKGAEGIATVYNHRGTDLALSVIHPHRYPEKLAPLLVGLGMCDGAVLVVEALDATLGERLVALDLAQVRNGVLLIGDYIDESKLDRALAGSVVASYARRSVPTLVAEGPDAALASSLRAELLALPPPAQEPGAPTMVLVDEHFPVKGVGTVALGVVRGAPVAMHQQLQAYPLTAMATVRSIQVHDEDVKEAPVGSRVGLALKDITHEQLDRGTVLAPPQTMQVATSLTAPVQLNAFYRKGLRVGQVVHVAAGLQVKPANITVITDSAGAPQQSLAAGAKGSLTITLEQPLVFRAGDRALVCDIDAAPPRVAAALTLSR